MNNGRNSSVVVVIAIVLLAAAALWYFGRTPESPRVPAEPPASGADATPRSEPAAPRYPVPQPDRGPAPRLTDLPPLDDSDEYFRMEAADLFGAATAELLVSEALIEKLVATIDNLPRPRVAERLRPVATLDTPFATTGQDGSGEYRLGPDNYRRYDALVDRFVGIDLERLVELYRRYYPLFQKAYVGLGYPDGYFNDRLVEVLDHLLAMPEVREPVMLVRPHVLYRYADEALEAESGGRKLLVRIGPGNRERVLERLRALRARVVEFDAEG